jgi:formamidopyrimidine-DNA glycosylase
VPELPEVETTRRGIEPHIVGKKVTKVVVRQPRLRWPVSEELAQCLTGKTVISVGRRAKYLFVETTDGAVMIHLGMSGSLRILFEFAPPGKHDHVDIGFDDGYLLRFRDPRRFGSIFWLPGADGSEDEHSGSNQPANRHVLLDKLGPEPLSSEFDGDYLYRNARNRKVAVKLFIMNAQIVVGVGNIYANEALHLAGIRPDRAANRISRLRYDQLAVVIKDVLQRAIESGGTTLNDFVREDGSPGYFGQSLTVYGRGQQPCLQCQGTLREIRQGGRATVFCPACQH